jgi:hypothetical protein
MYGLDLARVKAALKAAEGTATRTAGNARTELEALNAQLDLADGTLDGIVKLGDTTLVMKDGVYQTADNVLKVVDAIAALQAAMLAQTAAGLGTPFSPVSPTGAPTYTYTPAQPWTPAAPAQATPPVAVDTVTVGLTPEQLAALQQQIAGALPYGAFSGGSIYGVQPQMMAFDTGGSWDVAGSGPKEFGPNVTLHGGETVNVSRRDTMDALLGELQAMRGELSAVKAEMASLRVDNRAGFTAVAVNTGRSAKQLEDWTGEGLPPTREDEEAA